MLKAQQQAVIQQANIAMVGLRMQEIQYFTQFFTSFGAQCCILGGFSMAAYVNIPGPDCQVLDDTPFVCSFGWQALYWWGGATSMTGAIFALLCSLYCSVYGQGLALRGPIGSMAKAVEGMYAEQEAVLNAFTFVCFFCSLFVIGMNFVIMFMDCAIICAIIVLGGMYYWYCSAIRIYNRFWFDKANILAEDEDKDDELDEHFSDGDKRAQAFNAKLLNKQASSKPPTQSFLQHFGFGRSRGAKMDSNTSSKTSSIFGGKRNAAEEEDDDASYKEFVSRHGNEDSSKRADTDETESTNTFSGYLSMKSTGSMYGESWVRRYFVLRGYYALYYASQEDYKKYPLKSLNPRPISFLDHSVTTSVDDEAYTLLLMPLDEDERLKVWEFRCDTKQELDAWAAALNKALAGSDMAAGDPRGEYDADDGRAANKRGSVISVRTKLH